MDIGLDTTAAKPKGLRASDDQPSTVPMRPREVVQKNPTTDQKRVRRQMARQQRTAAGDGDVVTQVGKEWRALCSSCPPGNKWFTAKRTEDEARRALAMHNQRKHSKQAALHLATEIPSSADKLRPGDVIRGPNNSTVTVKQVRNHKADSSKVLVDTEAGTLVVPRTQNFTLVPVNNRQREVPDQGPVAGSPVGDLPMGGRGQQDPSQGHQGDSCPVCGARMQLRRANGSALYVCPRDGYSVQANGIGAATDPDLLPQRRSALDTTADMRGPANECRGCGGDLKVDAVDHTEGTVHAHCQDCGMEHQLQNVQHATGSKKEWVEVTGFDSYITTTANTKSAIASRAHAVLNAPEGSL